MKSLSRTEDVRANGKKAYTGFRTRPGSLPVWVLTFLFCFVSVAPNLFWACEKSKRERM